MPDRSEGDQPDGRVQDPEMAGVGCDDVLVATACTNHDVGVGYIGGPAGGQQPADIRRIAWASAVAGIVTRAPVSYRVAAVGFPG
jgi:nucleoside phosphorylase